MYNFIDVNEASESTWLPSEALKINGEYIENLIDGYRTLQVAGREGLSPELTTIETGVRDGSTLKNKRFPDRVITVTYQLLAESNEAFREAFNKLAGILNVENAELIFNDEQDKFYTGTPSKIGDVEPGLNCIVGEFEILCTDPFKYSVLEYEAEADLEEGTILIDYKGTYKSYPTLVSRFYNEEEIDEDGETIKVLTGGGDCGYVAFFNEDERIIQIGDPDEVDGETAYAKSQTLFNLGFNKVNSWGNAAKQLCKVNSGVTSSNTVVQTGDIGMGVASYAVPATQTSTSGTLLTATSRAANPYVNYSVVAKTSERTQTSVKVAITITASLNNEESYFLTGYGLKASVYIGGAWHDVTLKNTDDQWRGKTGHSVNLVVTVTGLTANTNALTGIKFKVARTDNLGKTGILNVTSCNNLTISKYVADVPETYYLTAKDFGIGSNWHGASITRTIPADASGVTGAIDFTLSYSQKMCIGYGKYGPNQLGAFQVLLVSGSGANKTIVAGVNIYKGSCGKKANLRFYINGAVAETTTVDMSYNNRYFYSSKSSTITKTGDTVVFNICGIRRTFRNEDITSAAVTEATFTFSRWGTKPGLSYNGLYWAKFVKNNCNTWKDIPNKFSANDLMEADCKTGEIFLNGIHTPGLGALGNDWERFYLKPGLNQIGFAYSDWVKDDCAPNPKVRYREVYL